MASTRALTVLLALAGVLAASCTSSTPPVASQAPPPAGELVAVTSDQTATQLVRYRPDGASSSTLDSPIDPEAVNRATLAGVAGTNGTMFVTAGSRELQAYDLPPDAESAEPLGPPLDVRAEQGPRLQISETGAVVATCDDVQVLPLPTADRWRSIGPSCWAALDPTGSSVAVEVAGHVLLHRLEGGHTPSLLFDLSDLEDTLGTNGPVRLMGTPSWSESGLAFFVRAHDQLGVFIHQDDGRMIEVLQERYTNVYRVPHLAWSPDGSVLAITDDVGPNPAVLRLYDPNVGELRALSLFPVGYAGLQWAPDGAAIAVLTGTGDLLVVGVDGATLLRRSTDWRALLGWGAS